mmetsp:Transcript_21959/g.69051  ORF Transcript_21959/g.69051 Transcript_21959/m.69051 type:complete len:368 (-) Transcript_21959:63-1166(-)
MCGSAPLTLESTLEATSKVLGSKLKCSENRGIDMQGSLAEDLEKVVESMQALQPIVQVTKELKEAVKLAATLRRPASAPVPTPRAARQRSPRRQRRSEVPPLPLRRRITRKRPRQPGDQPDPRPQTAPRAAAASASRAPTRGCTPPTEVLPFTPPHSPSRGSDGTCRPASGSSSHCVQGNSGLPELLAPIHKIVGSTAAVLDRFDRLAQDVGGLKRDVGGLKQDVGGLKENVEVVSRVKEDARMLKLDVSNLTLRQSRQEESQRKADLGQQRRDAWVQQQLRDLRREQDDFRGSVWKALEELPQRVRQELRTEVRTEVRAAIREVMRPEVKAPPPPPPRKTPPGRAQFFAVKSAPPVHPAPWPDESL